jgi:hypothetical protein
MLHTPTGIHEKTITKFAVAVSTHLVDAKSAMVVFTYLPPHPRIRQDDIQRKITKLAMVVFPHLP